MSQWAEVRVTINRVYAVELERGQTEDDAIQSVIQDMVPVGGDVTLDRRDVVIAKSSEEGERIRLTADERLPL